MTDLFNIVAEMAFELPPERLDFIAVQAEKMQTSINISKLKKAWSVNTDSALFERFFANVEKHIFLGPSLLPQYEVQRRHLVTVQNKGKLNCYGLDRKHQLFLCVIQSKLYAN